MMPAGEFTRSDPPKPFMYVGLSLLRPSSHISDEDDCCRRLVYPSAVWFCTPLKKIVSTPLDSTVDWVRAIWTILLIQNGVQLSKGLASRQPGYLDFDNLPETNFTCEGKVIGGYYADVETGCQMFHVCTIGQKGDMTDIKFLCLNGTVFDQETRVCERVDEVDCSKSKDFYDLNLELYNNGFILPEDEGGNDSSKEDDLDEDLYDENYDADTEEAPETSSKSPSTTSTTPPSTTTTTTTTTPRPIIFSSLKPTFSIILPNLNTKNSGTHITDLLQNKNVGSHIASTASPAPQQQQSQQPQQQTHYSHKNVGTHLTGLIPTKNIQITQTQRPFGFVTTQNYNPEPFKQTATIDTGLKPPPSNYKPYTSGTPTTTFKPPVYDPYKNHFFSSSTPTILINSYKKPVQEVRPSEQSKRPVVVLTHHFPTITPLKGDYDDFTSFSSPSAPGLTFVRQKNRPHVGIKIQSSQQHHQHPQIHIQHPHQHHHHHSQQHPHKPNPTILALQSQQQKVHRLHQEGLEIAEHQIAQITSRNAEISNLRSQQREEATSRRDNFEPQPSHREIKEIKSGDTHSFGKPAIAIVTSTSSTSSRVQKAPVITVQTVSRASGKPVIGRIDYKPETEYKTELEKLFPNTEIPKKEKEDADMDLEQLLLAWKLKTNQEVTKEDIEKVFARLDTSKFKNGQTISLSDIFNLMNNDSEEVEEEITRVPPMSYDDYTEEDVPYDPFYKDVPKVTSKPSGRQKRNSDAFSNSSSQKQISNREPVFRTMKSSAIKLRKRPRGSSEPEISQINEESEKVATSTPEPFPETGFSCREKIPGGFYADTEVDCRLFHICSDAGNGSLVDHKFFCGDGTKFNQRSRTCQAEALVDCRLSSRYYHLNENFLIPKEEPVPEYNFEPVKVKSRRR